MSLLDVLQPEVLVHEEDSTVRALEDPEPMLKLLMVATVNITVELLTTDDACMFWLSGKL